MYTPTPPPPAPPPKPNSHDVSRLGTPATHSPHPLGSDNSYTGGLESMGISSGRTPNNEASGLIPAPSTVPGGAMRQYQQQPIPDPGDAWIPSVLEDKSKQDLADILSSPSLLQALNLSQETIHPSLSHSQDALLSALSENVGLAQHLTELESRLEHQRASTQAQLLSAHALERQWRAKQADTDAALAPFAPAALYTRLTQALQEQEMLCAAMEESFLEGGGEDGNLASEREMLDWVRRYREARRTCYLRGERKERWNERRVGGWR
ncbi:hypothetical protein F5Y18DRAFT_168839 [Xylariaceae sp. FL1019]|nr:hypothetical protein F5Y18DRAFT_168839 [Xylariaceae sp. FL1019]